MFLALVFASLLITCFGSSFFDKLFSEKINVDQLLSNGGFTKCIFSPIEDHPEFPNFMNNLVKFAARYGIPEPESIRQVFDIYTGKATMASVPYLVDYDYLESPPVDKFILTPKDLKCDWFVAFYAFKGRVPFVGIVHAGGTGTFMFTSENFFV